MTDISRFDNHTPGPWLVTIFGGEDAEIWITEEGDSATNIDVELMSASPALLARVKELEALLKRIHSALPRGGDYNGEYGIDKVLNKEWLDG